MEADESKGVELMTSLEEGVLVVVIDSAELNSAEVLNQVLLAHEEGAIVKVCPASYALGFVSPAVR